MNIHVNIISGMGGGAPSNFKTQFKSVLAITFTTEFSVEESNRSHFVVWDRKVLTSSHATNQGVEVFVSTQASIGR